MSRGVVSPGGPGEGLPGRFVGMWSGPADEIPEGWALCDGTGGTPDLRGRFVLGAGGSYDVGATGGEETHVLTVAEMPNHTHRMLQNQLMPVYREGMSGVSYIGHSGNHHYDHEKISDYLTTDHVGGSQAHNNMPPYYALCYIMKL